MATNIENGLNINGLTGDTYSLSVNGSAKINSYTDLTEIVAPLTPSTGEGRIYAATDGTIHFINDGGTDYDLTTGGGGLTARSQETGTSITFSAESVYNTNTTPGTGNIGFNNTGGILGIIQKIYHNDTVVPSFSGVSNINIVGDGIYFPNELNIIYAEWVSINTVEYWVTQYQ